MSHSPVASHADSKPYEATAAAWGPGRTGKIKLLVRGGGGGEKQLFQEMKSDYSIPSKLCVLCLKQSLQEDKGTFIQYYFSCFKAVGLLALYEIDSDSEWNAWTVLRSWGKHVTLKMWANCMFFLCCYWDNHRGYFQVASRTAKSCLHILAFMNTEMLWNPMVQEALQQL